MRVALALSGGGVRASVFHCGALQRLALDGLLESTTFVSTVSGGSLVVGLILCQNGHRWPGSDEFLNEVVSRVRARLTTATLQGSYAWRSVALPWRLARGRAHVLAGQLEAQWGIHGSMQDVTETPRWIVNATCYETGRNWRFSRPRMGDYVTNYVLEPAMPIADAIAASAAVPGLIGPLAIRSDEYDWHRYEKGRLVAASTPAKRYALWDGGVYDNLGVEPLFQARRRVPRRLRLPAGERCIGAAVPRSSHTQASAHAVAPGASSGGRGDGPGARAARAIADRRVPAVPGCWCLCENWQYGGGDLPRRASERSRGRQVGGCRGRPGRAV